MEEILWKSFFEREFIIHQCYHIQTKLYLQSKLEKL